MPPGPRATTRRGRWSVRPGRRPRRTTAALTGCLAFLAVALAACTGPPTGLTGGYVRAPGGPFLTDAQGRVLILHGVNAVEKRAPYELVPAPGKAWNFSAADAARIARLGFDVVRLGIEWQGLEPGTAGANDPAICTPGTPANPLQMSRRPADAYIARLQRTVALLAAQHLYVLLDLHEDVYSDIFGGEGAPPWAVCTEGNPVVIPPGRWSRAYGTPAVRAAFTAFFTNDVVGDLQGQFDQVWAMVAHAFRDDRWVIGYDVLNEPLSVPPPGGSALQGVVDLECFYTGLAHPGDLPGTTTPVTCPPDDPAEGVVPTIEQADPHHLVFVEPDIAAAHTVPAGLGAMDLPRLVLEFHAYCSDRNPVTGNPIDEAACAAQASRTVERFAAARATLSTRRQPGGPPMVLGEFGASSDPTLADQVATLANHLMLGWAYWSWKYYDDPTGSSDEALVTAAGHFRSTVDVLADPYAQAVAGRPTATAFERGTLRYTLTYRAFRKVHAPTVVFVPSRTYPQGFCAQASGGSVRTGPGSPFVDVTNAARARTVKVTVTPGTCDDPEAPRTGSSPR